MLILKDYTFWQLTFSLYLCYWAVYFWTLGNKVLRTPLVDLD